MIRVLMHGPKDASGGVATHTKYLIKELEKIGVKIIPHYSYGSPINKIYKRTLELFLKSIKERKNYDIIHIQASGGLFSFIAAITGTISSKIVKKKVILTFHYSKTQKFVKKYQFIFKFILKYLNKLILVSKKQKDIIILYCNNSEKIYIIPNGYDEINFNLRNQNYCREQLNLSNNDKIIFNISNLIENKGHRYLLMAIAKIVYIKNDIKCFIAGKGNLKNELEHLKEQLNLHKCINFLDWIPDNEIPLWMNASDLFVLPSLNEGNPTVMFEALGCGLPFVGTRVGGVPEIITSEDYGLLVEPGNAEDLAEKIMIALDKEWDREKIRKYAEQFTWENVAREIMEVYKEVLH